MSLFNSSNVLKFLSNGITSTSSVQVENVLPAAREALERMRTELLSKTTNLSNFLQAITSIPELVSDQFADTGIPDGWRYLTQDNCSDFDNTYQVCQDIINNLADIATDVDEYAGSAPCDKGLTIVNSEGSPVTILITENRRGLWCKVPRDVGSHVHQLLILMSDPLKIWFDEHIYYMNGKEGSIWDLVRNLADNESINDALIRLCNVVLGAKDNIASQITGLLQLATSNKSMTQRIIDVYTGAVESFTQRGLMGLCQYLLNFYGVLLSTTDNNGVLQFTDNSNLVPKVYIAGTLSVVATTVSVIATAIISIASRVAGAVFYALSSVTSMLIANFDQAYLNEYASNNYGDSFGSLYGAPFGIFQDSPSFDNISHQICDAQANGGSFCYRVPGGYLLAGPQGHSGTYNVEFHPDLVNRISRLKSYNASYSAFQFLGKSTPTATDTVWSMRFTNNRWADTAAKIEDFMNQFSSTPDSDAVADSSGNYAGYYTGSNHTLIRKIIAANTIIFFMYIMYNDSNLASDVLYKMYRQTTQGSTIASWYDDIEGVTGQTFRLAVKALMRMAFWIFCDDQTDGPNHMSSFYTWTLLAGDMDRLTSYPYDAEQGWNFRNIAGFILASRGSGWYDQAFEFDSRTISWCLTIPSYSASKSRAFLATISLALVSTAIIGVGLTVAATRFIRNKRLQNAIAVQNAYEAAQSDPSQQNYALYRKAVFKNNLWSNIIGGHKYSKDDYWWGDSSSADDVPSATWSETLRDYATGLVGGNDEYTTTDIYRVITGQN